MSARTCPPPEHADAALDGLEAAGGRALFAYGYAPGPATSDALPDHASRIRDAGRLRRTRLSTDDRLVHMGIALTEMQVPWEQSKDEIRSARDLDVPITLHCSAWPVEKSEVQLLLQEDLLGPDLLFVHCTFSSEDDLRAIRDSGGAISATPETELQMGMGFPVVGRALRAGVRPGKDADLIVIDATAPNMTPLNRAREGIVMQAHAGNVETVMVRGTPVKLGGALVGQDWGALRRRLIASRDAVLARAGGVAALLGQVDRVEDHWDMGNSAPTNT